MRHPVSTCLPRAERRAAPEPVLSLVEGPARVPSGDRPTYSSDEGSSSLRAERRAAPKPVLSLVEGPARVPSGDRPMYSSDEGSS